MALRQDILNQIDAALDDEAAKDFDTAGWWLNIDKVAGPAYRVSIGNMSGFSFVFNPMTGGLPVGDSVEEVVDEFLTKVIEEIRARRRARRGQ